MLRVLSILLMLPEKQKAQACQSEPEGIDHDAVARMDFRGLGMSEKCIPL